MSRVLLANPPAPRPTMRDYYCSSSSKAGYAWHPIDLLAQGAWLKEQHTLIWRDFAVSPASEAQALARVEEDRPDVIIGLVGAAAPDDFAFWREARARTGARLFVSGDLARFAAEETLAANEFIEGLLLDFTAPALCDHLEGRAPAAGLKLRDSAPTEDARGPFAYPIPPHEMVWALPYRHPFLPLGFATVLTDFGCPHRCRYCNSGALGWRPRDFDNLAAELAWLAARSRRALFLKDMTFNADPQHTAAVLNWLRTHGPWQFACYVRPDRVTAEQAQALKQAGCVMAMAGIESGDDAALAEVRPQVTTAAVEAGVAHLHRAGVPVGGHFLLGLPGDTDETFTRTIDLARRLPLAYASFNLASPRIGSALHEAGEGIADGSSAGTRLLTATLPRETLLRRRRDAVRQFYGRPTFLLRQTWRAVRHGLFWRQLRHGLALLRQS